MNEQPPTTQWRRNLRPIHSEISQRQDHPTPHPLFSVLGFGETGSPPFGLGIQRGKKCGRSFASLIFQLLPRFFLIGSRFTLWQVWGEKAFIGRGSHNAFHHRRESGQEFILGGNLEARAAAVTGVLRTGLFWGCSDGFLTACHPTSVIKKLPCTRVYTRSYGNILPVEAPIS